LLLFKQTLEASYQPRGILLDGPNVQIARVGQLLTKTYHPTNSLKIGIEIENGTSLKTYFSGDGLGLFLERMTLSDIYGTSSFVPHQLTHKLTSFEPKQLTDFLSFMKLGPELYPEWETVQNRCFLQVDLVIRREDGSVVTRMDFKPAMAVEPHILEIIHLPGLRSKPMRQFPTTSVGSTFQGTFDDYTASIVANWLVADKQDSLLRLQDHLFLLGLTRIVTADLVNDSQVELRVGRTPYSAPVDTVNIADVGIGVSQTLPVLVALLTAKPGQLVYIEQPEIHLHPRAQTAMAKVLADAAKRGVRVVIETHSSLLLLGIQTLVAEGKLSPDLVKLHWFERNNEGATFIRSADLDEGGRFGDWPEDFGDVTLDAQDRFLTAAEHHMAGV